MSLIFPLIFLFDLIICSESERRSWSLAFSPPEVTKVTSSSNGSPSGSPVSGEGGDSDEKIYADWDCPEVEIVADYSAEVNNSLETNHPDPVGGDTAGNDYLDVKSGERMKVMRKLTSSGIFTAAQCSQHITTAVNI